MVQNTPLKIARNLTATGMTEPVTVRRACDGPSCRSVARVRELFQNANFSKSLSVLRRCSRRSVVTVTVRPARPSQISETHFQDSNLQFQVFWYGTPSTVRRAHDGPSWCPSHAARFFQNKNFYPTTKQVVTIGTNLPIVRPRTIKRRKTRAKRST